MEVEGLVYDEMQNEAPLYTFPCNLASHKGEICVYEDRFQFSTAAEEVAIVANWSLLALIQNQKKDSLTLEVSNSIRWQFSEIQNYFNAFSVLDKFTRKHKGFSVLNNAPIWSALESCPIVNELFLLEPQVPFPIPGGATQVMSEIFPLPMKIFLGYILSEEVKFFYRLHSRRDCRLKYGAWRADPKGDTLCRTVKFDTNQAPITVGVTQKHKLYKTEDGICLDIENNFEGFPGSSKMTVFAFHRISPHEADTKIDVFAYVDIGFLFVGKRHAVRESIEDIQEYSSRFKARIEEALLAGVDTTGEGTLERLEKTKQELENFQTINSTNAAAKGHLNRVQMCMFVVIFFQLLAIVQLLLF